MGVPVRVNCPALLNWLEADMTKWDDLVAIAWFEITGAMKRCGGAAMAD